jgi:hypothetical protein
MEPSPLKISEALDASHYPRVAEKAANGTSRYKHWCDADECMCMGCLNKVMTWAEYECWRKYAPEFNKPRVESPTTPSEKIPVVQLP